MRDLKNNFNRYHERNRSGEHIIDTDTGDYSHDCPPLEASNSGIATLIEAGLAQRPKSDRGALPKLIAAAGIVSDLVAEQRR